MHDTARASHAAWWFFLIERRPDKSLHRRSMADLLALTPSAQSKSNSVPAFRFCMVVICLFRGEAVGFNIRIDRRVRLVQALECEQHKKSDVALYLPNPLYFIGISLDYAVCLTFNHGKSAVQMWHNCVLSFSFLHLWRQFVSKWPRNKGISLDFAIFDKVL